MLPDLAELAARVANLRTVLFTEFTAVGLGLALAVALVGRRLSDAGRERMVIAASLLLVLWFAGPPPTLALAAWAVGFGIAVEAGTVGASGRVAALGLLACLVAAPVVAIGRLGDGPPHAREFVAFATNMMLLRAIAWMRARWRGDLAACAPERAFVACFFFPTFVNGPIETAAELVRPLPAASAADVRAGLRRIATGVARILAAALVMPLGGTSALADGPAASALFLWCWAARLYLWFYLSFSAWSDVAIGLGRLCGRPVRENFERPWLATGPGDFWRRWHMSLGVWLRDVVYIPLGGNQRHRTANVCAVFLVSAVWHVWGTLKLLGFGYYPPAAWIGFLTWGGLHALAVSALGRRSAGARVAVAARVATFAFAAFAWVPFFTPAGVSWTGLARMLARMVMPIVP